MTIALRDDLAYMLLKKIADESSTTDASEITISPDEFAGKQVSEHDVIDHLDYLNQKGYIAADFSRESDTEAGVTFTQAEVTDKGRKMLEKMETNPPASLREGPVAPIASKDMAFLEKVMLKANLPDVFDAREITTEVFRTMRDLMTTEAADHVESELHKEMLHTKNKRLQKEIADLWKDTNPLVGFISRLRPPFHGPAPFIIDSDLFVFRIEQEGGLPGNVNPETAIKAVFSATKDELSEERIQEVAGFLPDRIRKMWEEA